MRDIRLEREDGGFCIDAALLGELLGLPAAEIHALIRNKEITSVCERGEGEHAGRHRLTFTCRSRRVRLDVDDSGRVLRRSTIDFGDQKPPRARRA